MMWNAFTDLLQWATLRSDRLALFLTRRVHRAWVKRGCPTSGKLFDVLCAVSP